MSYPNTGALQRSPFFDENLGGEKIPDGLLKLTEFLGRFKAKYKVNNIITHYRTRRGTLLSSNIHKRETDLKKTHAPTVG